MFLLRSSSPFLSFFFMITSFVCKSSSFEIGDTHFPFKFLFFDSDFGAFDALLLGLISFKKLLICILNWIPTRWWSSPRVFLKYIYIYIFQSQRKVQWNFYWYLRMKKHDHISFWILIAWFLERLTPTTDFNDSQHLSFLFLFLSSYFLLRLPFAGFQSNRLLLSLFFQMLLRKRDWN